MTKYPNSECEAHRDVKTSQPVCIICMGNEIERLEKEVARLQPGAANRSTREEAIRHEAFATGVVYATARLVEMFDQPGMADDILRESGVDVRMAAEYDVAFLRRENKKLAKGRE